MREPLKTGRGRGGGGGTPCCSKVGLKTGQWTSEEDELLASYVRREGEGKWRTMPKRAGLLRCGKSCRLRWMNYLRPSVKRGQIAPDEEDLILRLHRLLGNRWSLIAGRIPGRTDNEIKNYWNTHLSKKLLKQGIDPRTHMPLLNPTCSTKTAAAPSTQQEAVAVKEEEEEEEEEEKEAPQQVMTNVVGDEELDVNFSDDMLSGFLDSLVVDVDVFLRQDLNDDKVVTDNNPTETLESSLPPFGQDEFWDQVVHPSAITLDQNGDVDDHFHCHSDSQI